MFFGETSGVNVERDQARFSIGRVEHAVTVVRVVRVVLVVFFGTTLLVGSAEAQDPNTTVEFSGTTVGAPTLQFPAFGSDATECVLAPTPEPYFVQPIAVDSSDTFQIRIVEPIDLTGTGDTDDTILTLYGDSLATDDPCLGFIALGNEVVGDGLDAALTSGRQYVLVVSGFLGSEDDFRLSITGPQGRSIWLGHLGTGVADNETRDPLVELNDAAYRLGPVYPNPFSGLAEFSVEVSEDQDVRVEALDLLGRRVGVVFDGRVTANAISPIRIDGSAWPPGMYFVRVVGENFRETRVVTLVR